MGLERARHIGWAGGLLVLLVGAGVAQDDPAAKELKRLEGVWTMHAMEVNGTDVAPARIQGTVLTVKGDRYEVKIKDKVVNAFILKLDPKKEPKELDMVLEEGANKDKVHKAIYKIEKDLFIFCRGLNPEQERPNQFATWPGTSYFVVTWKKQ